MSNPLTPGRYRHYSGREYEVLFLAKDSKTEESVVVYRALYGVGQLWVKPLAGWLLPADVNGAQVPRFERT